MADFIKKVRGEAWKDIQTQMCELWYILTYLLKIKAKSNSTIFY
jgi:hypothetical protein